jgi:hypothetical protein
MGVNERTHTGQLLASQRETESPTPETACHFCGTPIAESDDTERVEHVLPSDTGKARSEQYCSPSCFVRRMERVGSID